MDCRVDVRVVLGPLRNGDVKACKGMIDVAQYEHIKGSLLVILIESNLEVEDTGTVDGGGIHFVEGVVEVL